MSSAQIHDEIMETWSGEQIKDAIGPRAMKMGRILIYKQLRKYNSIEQLLPKQRSFAVIFVAVNRFGGVGHWVIITRNKREIIFADSLGFRPDKQLSWTHEQLRKSLGQDEPHLSTLLNKAVQDGFHVKFVTRAYQHEKSNTCGRWVALRAKHLVANPAADDQTFDALVRRHTEKGEHPDEMIVQLVPE